MLRVKSLTTLLLIALCAVPLVDRAEAAKLAFSGVILDQGNNPVLSDFTAWLSKHANYPLEPIYTESYQAISDELRKHRKNIAWTCGAPSVALKQQGLDINTHFRMWLDLFRSHTHQKSCRKS